MKNLIGRKLGMGQIFSEEGKAVPVTVVEAGPCTVTQIKTREKEGYDAVQLGFEEVREGRLEHAQDRSPEEQWDQALTPPFRGARRRSRQFRTGTGVQGRHFQCRRQGRHIRHLQGQRFRRSDKTPRFRRRPGTSTRAPLSTARPGRSANAPRPRRSSRARSCRDAWDTSR